MGQTLIEKILSQHAGRDVVPGEIADITIDSRAARDFGGANVVKNLQTAKLGIADPARTVFTFDCYPGATDAKYATNQQICRQYAEQHGVRVSDINRGIGTHVAVDEGLVVPGETFVSTDSHANILGAIGAFGQGMGDQDIAHAWGYGTTWFKVPASVRIVLKGMPGPEARPKDVSLALLGHLGANGLLGYAAEIIGEYADSLSLDGRITISSQATEMGGIIAFFLPNEEVLAHCSRARGSQVAGLFPDPDARYEKEIEVDITDLGPLAARPGHPEDVAPVVELAGTRVHSGFIGSCTNGRMEDLRDAAAVLRGRQVAPGRILKIVPATDQIWNQAMQEGLFEIFKQAGALISNAGCAGCAAGQVGQNGPGEVTVSTGNRNYVGKQGKGDVFLASPATVAASMVAGHISTPSMLARGVTAHSKTGQPIGPVAAQGAPAPAASTQAAPVPAAAAVSSPQVEANRGGDEKPTVVEGRVWVIRVDNIDTDMIFHNRYLSITDIDEMGQYAFDNLAGWEDFSRKVQPGDIIVTGKNFGAGSSRQQAVDCFEALGVALIIARSYGAIYERNAINAGLPILCADLIETDISDGERIRADLTTGQITRLGSGETIEGQPFSETQLRIYQRGGLLA